MCKEHLKKFVLKLVCGTHSWPDVREGRLQRMRKVGEDGTKEKDIAQDLELKRKCHYECVCVYVKKGKDSSVCV